MEIRIGSEIECLYFGMTMEQVRSVIGEPNKTSTTERLEATVYTYDNLMMKLSFEDDENFRLCEIEIENPSAQLYGQFIIGCSKEDIVKILGDNGCEYEEEDYELHETINCWEIQTEFTFEFNRLRSLEFGPLWENNDVRMWPTIQDIVAKPFVAVENNLFKLSDQKIEARIHIGLGNLFFGMTQGEILRQWGEPDKIVDCDYAIVWFYYKQMIALKFDPHEELLFYSIEVHNPEVTLFGQYVLGETKEKMINLLLHNGYNELEYKNYDFFETIFTSEIWTTLSFRFNRVESFEYSPDKKDGRWKWPQR